MHTSREIFLSEVHVCLRRRRCNEQERRSARGSRPRRRLANSCVRKSSTFEKASMERGRPNRPSRSACRKRAERASGCRRRERDKRRPGHGRVQHAITARVVANTSHRRLDPAHRCAGSSANLDGPRQREPSRDKLIRLPDADDARGPRTFHLTLPLVLRSRL